MNVGILGSGQLGRMLGLAGYPLGLRFRSFDTRPQPCAAEIMPYTHGAFDDHAALAHFANRLDVVTYEFENVPVAAAEFLQARVPVYPPPAALAAAQERFAEKQLFAELGIATAPFAKIDRAEEIGPALAEIGTPAIWKTRRFGYDGKGQFVIAHAADADAAWQATNEAPALLEQRVDFDRELSIIAVRGRDGAIACYPLTENEHAAGILRLSQAPAPDVAPTLQAHAADYASRILTRLDYVGVLTVELFQVSDELLANEMAPRVHNSGHWTQDGAAVSQFENHLRAICGWPLGPTAARCTTWMLNLIGGTPPTDALLQTPGAAVHHYGKAPRRGRKIGHVNLTVETSASAGERPTALLELVQATADG